MNEIEEKKLKENLHEAQERFKALFEQGPLGATFNKMIYDENNNPCDYRFVYTNDNFKKYTGVSPEGMTAKEAFPGIENDPFDWIGKFAEVVKTGVTLHVEQYFPLNQRWYDLVAYSFKDDIFIVAFQDITTFKLAQLELEELNSGMRSIFDASSRVAIIKIDLDGKIKLFNRGAEKLLGYTPEEVIGKETPLLFHKKSEITDRSIELTREYGKPVKGLDVFTENAKHGKTDERDWTFISKSGEEKNVTLSITPIKNLKKELSGFLGTAVDITDRKRVEKKLKASEQLFKSFFDESNDAFMLLENGKFIDCNNATVKLFGLNSKSDFTKVHPSEASPKYQSDNVRSDIKAEKMMQIALLKGSHRFEWIHKKINGEEFPAEVLLTHIRDGERDLLHACVRDISDRKDAEEKLRQSQKMEVVGQLAGGVAHDFNNMLSGIIGATEILQSTQIKDPSYEKYLDIILQAAERASELTQQLLSFGRKGKQESVNINLNNVITAVAEILNHTINKNIKIITNFEANEPIINGDTALIQNAILNICVNARDAMPKGGTLKISTSYFESDGTLQDHENQYIPKGKFIKLVIKDTGTGISEKEINKIFEPFFTTKEEGMGTGLGLSSVYGTLKSHNSFLNIESELNKGSIFTLIFPISVSKEEKSHNKKIDISKSINGTILIIDDEEVLRHTMKVMLESVGISVILAENGIDGIKKYSKFINEIDIVIIDLIMPQLSGKDCLKELTKINAEIKTILVSGFVDYKDFEEMQNSPNSTFLKKPFRKRELLESVYKILN